MTIEPKRITNFGEKWGARIFLLTLFGLLALSTIGLVIILVKANPIPAMQSIYERDRYTFAYDYKTKQLAWIIEVLTPDMVSEDAEPIHTNYRLDPEIPPHMQAEAKDYENSGYVMANLLSFPNDEPKQLYLLTASPQLLEFNQGYWQKLNQYIKERAQQIGRLKIITISGPLYLPDPGERYLKYKIIGKNNVAVPTHFFKVLFPSRDVSQAEAYMIPNQAIDISIPLENFKVDLQELEKMSGIAFPQDLWYYFFTLPPKMF